MLLISLMLELTTECWELLLKILKIRIKTTMALTLVALLVVVITRAHLHLIPSQMTIANQLLLRRRSQSRRSPSLFQILFSWAKWMLLSNKSTIQWQMEFRIKWLMLITTKVECLSNNNMEQPWQATVSLNNNSGVCRNKTSSKQDIIKTKDSEDNLNNTINPQLAVNHRSMRSELNPNSNNTISSSHLSRRHRLLSICSDSYIVN